MIRIVRVENNIKSDKSHFSSFLIEPLENGQAVTLGNAIRRTLISEIYGYGIVSTRINDIKNKFSKITFCREDVLEILFNLKEIIFKESFLLKEKTQHVANFIIPGFLYTKGPLVVTAGMITLPKNTVTIINPNQYICTLVDNSDFACEIEIQKQKNVNEQIEYRHINLKNSHRLSQSNTFEIDANYSPILRVNYKTNLIYDIHGNLKEALRLEILTKGNITPSRCLQEACKSLMDLFFTIMINENFLKSTSELSNLLNEFSIQELDLKNNS